MDFVDKLAHFIRLLTIPDLADMLVTTGKVPVTA